MSFGTQVKDEPEDNTIPKLEEEEEEVEEEPFVKLTVTKKRKRISLRSHRI